MSVKSWHCNEASGVTELPEDWPAQFHSHDTYVVRWIYKVSLTGERSGDPDHKNTTFLYNYLGIYAQL